MINTDVNEATWEMKEDKCYSCKFKKRNFLNPLRRFSIIMSASIKSTNSACRSGVCSRVFLQYFSKTSKPFLLSCTDWIVSLCQFRGLGSVHRSGGDGSCRRHRCHRLWMECEKHKTAVRETCVLIKTIRDAVLLYLLMVIKCIVAWNEAEQAC